MAALLLLVVCLSQGAFASNLEDYILVSGVTSYADLETNLSTDLEILAKACSNDPLCHGFDTDGSLKSDTTHVFRHNGDMYVKRTLVPVTPTIWPWPQKVSSGSAKLVVNPATFTFQGSPAFPDLTDAFTWFTGIMFPHRTSGTPSGTALPSCVVYVTNISVPLQLGVDESYTLTVPSDGTAASIRAPTFYGAMQGLQTFSQLVRWDAASHGYIITSAPYSITDSPTYAHRGLLIDTARHYLPVQAIYKLIDSMSFAKFNVIHWHIVDTQSFPFESLTYPKLWNGAFSSDELYTQQDVQDVVEYARKRAMRVFVEFDTPGHAGSWCSGYPNVCPSPTCLEPLSPATEDTFTLLDSLFSELTGRVQGAGLFPDNFLHLGGDEVSTQCWVDSPSVNQWLIDNKMTPNEAYFYFINRTTNIALAQQRQPVNWEEVFNHFRTKLDPRCVVHAWKNKATVGKAVADGYRALNSDGWYLDHLGDLWTAYYLNDPRENITNPAQQALVLGGEGCMWGETVDESDLFNTIWPRAAAIAERLWSASTLTDVAAAQPRYQYFRCLLVLRGIGAAPSLNTQARTAPPNPGSCYTQ